MNTTYAELEIGLNRTATGDVEAVLRFSQPGDRGERAEARGLTAIDRVALRAQHLDAPGYGATLTAGLFHDAAVRAYFREARAAVEGAQQHLRIRLRIGTTAADLHGLRWELLQDPENHETLATSPRLLLSRFVRSADWRPIQLRSKEQLKALIAVADPVDGARLSLARVDPAVITHAETALAAVGPARLDRAGVDPGDPLTVDRLVRALATGIDLLYLVCHGAVHGSEGAFVWLQKADGTAERVRGTDLARRIRDLPQPPRLVVLASCESAGDGTGPGEPSSSPANPRGDVATLAPLLTEAGVSAVIAMQGRITMTTVRQMMPEFFTELLKEGHIERALAVARGLVSSRPDAWMPALFHRLKGGCIWYQPGFGAGDQKVRWDAVITSIKERRVTPVLGSGLVQHVYGDQRSTARRLARLTEFALAPHQSDQLPQVAQYYRVVQDLPTLRRRIKEIHAEAIRERFPEATAELGDDVKLSRLIEAAAGRLWADPAAFEPHRVLAGLPCRMYLTANPDDLLTMALAQAGKRPNQGICRFRDKTPTDQPESPSTREPLVYHMLGHFKDERSLVLTQDDHFDYLIRVSRDELIPKRVDSSVVRTSLLFLGFELDDWSFGVMFRRLKNLGGEDLLTDQTHIMVQIEPDEDGLIDPERARRYLAEYFTDQKLAKMSIYWGSARDFLRDLADRLHGVSLPAADNNREDDDDDY